LVEAKNVKHKEINHFSVDVSHNSHLYYSLELKNSFKN